MKKKIMLGTSDTWSMSRSSQRPNEPAYYIEDCRILTDCIHLFDDGTKLKIPPKITTQ